MIPRGVNLDGFVGRVEILIIGAEAGNNGFALGGFDTYRLRSCRMARGQQNVDAISKGDISAEGLEFQPLVTLPAVQRLKLNSPRRTISSQHIFAATMATPFCQKCSGLRYD